ncbi:MAG TPA: DNA polymerase III subunit alpha, partial [Chitinophagaceae bacterium]|nr:DNA polymerase III subunit alpha [Chitinophagaceae bacterium]
IEDFTGKTELTLWSDDYVKFQNYLEKGKNVLVTGYFKSRYNAADQFELKIVSINMLETAMMNLTRSVEINLHPAAVTKEMIDFVDKNVRTNPGKSTLKFSITEPVENLKVTMYTMEKGFSMNDSMADYLLNNPDVEVNVAVVG